MNGPRGVSREDVTRWQMLAEAPLPPFAADPDRVIHGMADLGREAIPPMAEALKAAARLLAYAAARSDCPDTVAWIDAYMTWSAAWNRKGTP